MSTTHKQFSSEELQNINKADDLKISPFRSDGVTYGTPTWIWAVTVHKDLYVRAYNGKNSRWYKSAVQQKAGRIHAAGMVKEVLFDSVPNNIYDLVDDAYRAKYKSSPYLSPMLSKRSREATIKIIPK